MFGKGNRAGGKIFAVADIGSGSVGVALFEAGDSPHVYVHVREELPLEERSIDALRSGVIQALSSAGEKALATLSQTVKNATVSGCYCVVGAPWTRSFTGIGASRSDHDVTVTDAMVGAVAKQALADQKNIDSAQLLEANVSRVLLNGYPTSEPAGKRAHAIELFTLASDCDAGLKSAATEALAKVFPGTQVVWRSSARALLAVTKNMEPSETCLIVEMGMETTDLIALRKGILGERVQVAQGTRGILATLAKGKPPEETLSLIDMLEKDQCESEACETLRQSIVKAEPELVKIFGEALAKLSTPRKLPDALILIAPPALLPWFTRFFSRIDFTQFTATTRQFSIAPFSALELPGIPRNDPSLYADPTLSIACELVNTELSS